MACSCKNKKSTSSIVEKTPNKVVRTSNTNKTSGRKIVRRMLK